MALSMQRGAGHAAVGGVDDGVAFQRGDIALPEIQSRLDGGQVGSIGNTLCGGLILQICVLHLQELRADARRSAKVHQSPQELALAVRIGWYGYTPVLRLLFQ
mgnify:CR=1 FL=1